MSIFKELMQKIREEAGDTQTVMAQKLGYQQAHLSMMERGKICIPRFLVEALKDTYNVAEEDLQAIKKEAWKSRSILSTSGLPENVKMLIWDIHDNHKKMPIDKIVEFVKSCHTS